MDCFSIYDLNFSYSDENEVFRDVSFEAFKGDRICILGENGTGKSTLLKILANIIPCKMKMDFFGKKDVQIKDEIRNITYVPDKPFLYDELTGSENLSFIASIFEEEKTKYTSTSKDLCERFNILSDLDTKVKKYSLGMQHKLFLAAILSRNSKLLLLDEPLTALDAESQKIAVDELIKKSNEGTILLFTSHIESIQNSIANKLFAIKEKKLCSIVKEGKETIEKNNIGFLHNCSN